MSFSTHVLDTTAGHPAPGLALTLSRLEENEWQRIGDGITDADGRCRTLLGGASLGAATYKIHFATAEYFASQRLATLYPFVEIVFNVADPAQHYHIPLLLTANGYTTYRGS